MTLRISTDLSILKAPLPLLLRLPLQTLRLARERESLLAQRHRTIHLVPEESTAVWSVVVAVRNNGAKCQRWGEEYGAAKASTPRRTHRFLVGGLESMEAAATSVRAALGSRLGLARSSLTPSDGGRLRRCSPPLSSLRPPWPAAPRLVCSSGARAWSSVAAAANSPRQQQQQLGEYEEAATMEPQRSSPHEVREEMARCFELVRRLGRGAVYLGSSRVPATHPHYLQAAELAREIARLLDCTTWTGAGPGLMDAATQGALEAGKLVGGLKIAKEAGEWTASNFHPYLPSESYLTCRFFSARKHGLVDAVVRNCPTDRTAVIALPGGIGTLDELFEMMALIQLERIGSTLPVPFLLLNYDSYYSKLLEFLNDCEEWGTVAPGEVPSLWKVCNGNHEALEYLAQFYNVSVAERNYCISPQLKQQRTSYVAS